ncbi:tetratricopeptide repeat protein [Azorhizobium doebereinerae]|uniref:tetratricopeptide repeat protein n=1 Tax=Azorhizobium doebereinerae TaxID=281091 RepID=UPI000413C723|nr:tetratricopeptide repeat protein [Azorhizobium doebereinerae]
MSPDPRAVLAQASQLHRAGQLDAAIDAYRTAARLAPGFLDAHRLLALALLQAGRAKDAVRAARQARDIAPRDPNSHILVGAGLLLAGDAQKALAAFDDAAKLAPGLIEAQFQAGNALAALGRHAAAAERFTRALAIDPRSVEALTNRATAYARLERHAEALADCERLIAMQPWVPIHHVSKAGTLLEMGDVAGALAAAETAIAAGPRYADAYHIAAQAKASLGDLPGACALMARAVELNGDARPELKVRLAHMRRLNSEFAAALELCDAVLATHPRLAEALVERADVHRALGAAAAALADADAALAIQPDAPLANLARASALADLGRSADMRVAIGRAARAAPREPRVLFTKAGLDLATGAWAAGWAGYEAREHMLPPPFTPPPFPRWDGRTPPQDLVILAEQGIGDVLQFARLLSLVADRGLPARLFISAALAPLVATIEPRIPVTHDISHIPADAPGTFWLPLASLPAVFAPDPAMWPTVPYLQAPQDRVAKWAHLRAPGNFLVGINWQGNPSRLIDIGRSAPLAAFAPLAAVPGVTLVSLQHGAAAAQVGEVPFGERIVTLGADVDADGIFLDRAGVMANLDLVVTTDTSAAHLAGALGRPAFVALRATPDWRWGLEGEHSLYYPSLHLVRQQRAGDWDGVFAAIAGLIAARVSGGAHGQAPGA